jgi:hypothetical protein
MSTAVWPHYQAVSGTPKKATTSAELAARFVTLRLPSWLWGGDLSGMAEACGWQLEAEDAAGGRWRLRLLERAKRRPGRLLTVHRLADAGNVGTVGAYARLTKLPPHDPHLDDADRREARQQLDRLARERQGDLGAALSSMTLVTVTALESELAATVRQCLHNGLLPVLPGAAAHLIEVDAALSYRFKFTAALLQVKDDPQLLARPMEDFPGFASAQGLFTDTLIGLDAYLTPLLLSLAPQVWGFAAARAGGVIVYTLGTPIMGRRGEAAEPLQLFAPRGNLLPKPAPSKVSATELEAAMGWWIAGLDAMFTEATDPANYRAADGSYAVHRAFEALLSLEQAFRNVQSISVHDRDPHVRRVLLFDTLDTLEGMRLRLDFREMCRLARAQATLKQLEWQLPRETGAVLLPRARAAVAALKALQEGFFLPSRRSRAGVLVPTKDGDEILPLDEAGAAYLRVLRNAGHSFGRHADAGRARDEALLMAHNGQIPHELADLAYLYLLRLLAAPELLRRWP